MYCRIFSINRSNCRYYLECIFIVFLLFIIQFSINIIPSYAAETTYVHNDTIENNDCASCHFSEHARSFQRVQNLQTESPLQTSAQIKSLTPSAPQTEALVATDVSGNITLIASIGQDWYQQGIFGSSDSPVGVDKSWGWTFFEQNPPSKYITPSEKVTQRNNIYTLLLDDGNNSNPITGAQVVANVTYWLYYGGNGTNYTSNIKSINLTEDEDHRGLYNGRFDFYGGTDGASGCTYCHNMHRSDTKVGYFPGNYTVSIKAEVDNKIVTKNVNFEVTPWGCEDCHGSGSRHRSSAPDRHIVTTTDMDSACYLCHGINRITGMYDAGNPHQNTAHRNIKCEDCHTNRSISSQSFTGVNFTIIDNKPIPQYNNSTISLSRGTHTNLTCTDCHGNLTLSNPGGGYNSNNYTINEVINNYDPSFTSIRQFLDYYVINVTGDGSQNISLNWTGDPNIGFYLYPPNFNPQNFTNLTISYGSTFTNKPEVYNNPAPAVGLWILQIYGYNLNTNWTGNLQLPINYTINSTYPVQRKDFPSIPECNNCHNSNGSGKAFTDDEIPDWNPGFSHADTNNDGTPDIQCRMCHNAMHDITIKTCQTCHTTAPTNHPITEPAFSQYTQSQCIGCHGSAHNLLGGGSCTQCHSATGGAPAVESNDLGGHINLNTTDGGTDNLTDSDCMTCHYQNPHGGPDSTRTYYCADCHTTAGAGPKKSSIIFTDKLHGENTCMDCHVADGNYHQGNPRGSVANSTYIARYTTSNTIATDCADCHYAANLDDAPFNAPSGGSHIISNGVACAKGGCHPAGNNMIQTIHKVGGLSSATQKPTISVPTLNSSNVMQGTDVIVTATVNHPPANAFVDGAQYRIKSVATEVRSWTPMSANDGNFNGSSEVAVATIKTNILSGTYTIEVRGMAGGPAQNTSMRYYPMNGNVSAIKSTTLTVLAPMGYINGTVKSGITAIEGVFVSVPGASDTTKPDGTYSLRVPEGTYTVNASKQPTHYDTSVPDIGVTQSNTTIANISISQKPTGNITGSVTNI